MKVCFIEKNQKRCSSIDIVEQEKGMRSLLKTRLLSLDMRDESSPQGAGYYSRQLGDILIKDCAGC